MGKWKHYRGAKRRWAKKRVITKYGNTCYLCNKPIATMRQITIDHWIPISKGGTDDISNLRPAHEKCNRDKAAMTPEEWYNFNQKQEEE